MLEVVPLKLLDGKRGPTIFKGRIRVSLSRTRGAFERLHAGEMFSDRFSEVCKVEKN